MSLDPSALDPDPVRQFDAWLSRPDRLHDRVEYLPDGAGGWALQRPQP